MAIVLAFSLPANIPALIKKVNPDQAA